MMFELPRALLVEGASGRNEDRAGVIERDWGAIVVVADGAGGIGGGAVATELVVETVREGLSEPGERTSVEASIESRFSDRARPSPSRSNATYRKEDYSRRPTACSDMPPKTGSAPSRGRKGWKGPPWAYWISSGSVPESCRMTWP